MFSSLLYLEKIVKYYRNHLWGKLNHNSVLELLHIHVSLFLCYPNFNLWFGGEEFNLRSEVCNHYPYSFSSVFAEMA